MNRTFTTAILCVLTTVACSAADAAALALPGTKPLEWPEEDLSARLMDGAHQFIERQIQASRTKRARFWNYDTSSKPAYQASVAENRQELCRIIGVVDPRMPVRMERFGDDAWPEPAD